MSDVKPGRRERYAALTRAAIVEAAEELFVTKGFGETSVEEIAARSETSKGAVYHHFGDKREMFAEAFRAKQAGIMQAALESVTESGAPWDSIETATREFLGRYLAADNARALLRQAIEVLGWNRVRAIDEETALPLLRTALEEFTEAGAIRPLPIDTTAKILFSLYCDAVLFVAASDSHSVDTSQEIETVILALLRGLKPPESDVAT